MSTGAATARRPLLHNRDFLLLWGGQLASWVGTEVSGIALPLLVLALTGSPARAGLVAAVRGATLVLLALPAGALIDRWDRRRTMVLANAGSGVAMGSICVALLLGHLSIAQIYVASAAEGACFVFANLARFAALRRVVPAEHYPAALAQTSLGDYIALLIGPPVGGLLYQLAGAGVALFTDACSYVVNALSIFFITAQFQDPQERAQPGLVADIRAGMNWLWNQRVLKRLNLLVAGRTAVASGLYLLIVVLAGHDRASSAAVGGIFAVSALGGILGATVAGRVHHRFHARSLLWATMGATWILVSCYALATTTALIAAVTASIYFVGPFFEIAAATCTTVAVPDVMRGRVSSWSHLVELGADSLGYLATGMLLQYAGTAATIVFLSGTVLTLTLFARLNPSFRAR